MDLNEFLKDTDLSKLRGDFSAFQKMLNTSEGRVIKEKLGKLDKNQLKAKLSTLGGGQVPNEDDISKLMSDPNLLKKINKFLDN